ncbi:hypothetical protein J14TS5_35100 [Paenibacillus lautus]|nr:hypothetical protein J14TS5_35100 [Paenibacillus lautus]
MVQPYYMVNLSQMNIAVDNNHMFIIKRRGVVDHENADTKNDVAGIGARPNRVDRIRGSDDGIGAWIEAKGGPGGPRYP